MTTPDPPQPETPADPLVGSVLAGRYRIVRRLGEGAMGAVYLGEHMRFGRRDAIKVLREEMAQDREATERFLRGARNVSAINHPNVCTVYDFGDTDDGRQFLAMEFVEGETLADTLEREGRLPLERSVEIVRQIALALDAAHHTGIVHRDLKPGNVMIARARDGGDMVKVVDFDIAKGSAEGAGAEVTRTGFVVGTPEYMSPEQLIGDPLDHRSDVYSLAVVFVRILTGALPVRATTTQDLMVERLTREPLSLAELVPDLDLPPSLQAALDGGLERRREDRPESAGALAASLLEAADGTSTAGGGAAAKPAPTRTNRATDATVPPTEVAAPPSTGEVRAAQQGPSGGPKPTPWLVGGGVAVAALVIGVLSFGGGDTPRETETASMDGPSAPDERSAEGPTDPVADQDPASFEVPDTTATGTEGSDDEPVGPTTDPRGDDAAPPEATPEPTVTPAEAEALLNRLADLLIGTEPAGWRSAADSARMVASQESGLSSELRATAALLAAQSYMNLGRTDDALQWARRALELNPANRGARALVDRLGGEP